MLSNLNNATSNFLDAFKSMSPMQARSFLDMAPQVASSSNDGDMDVTNLSAEVDFQRHRPIDPTMQDQFAQENEAVPGADQASTYNTLLKTAQLDPNAGVDYDDDGLRHMSFKMPAGQQREIVADPQSGSLSDTVQRAGAERSQTFERDGEVLTGHSDTAIGSEGENGGGRSEGERQEKEEEGGAYEASEITAHIGHTIGEFGHALQEVGEVFKAGEAAAPAVNALAASDQAKMNWEAASAAGERVPTAATSSAAAPAAASAPRVETLRTPVTQDMQDLVDAIKSSGAAPSPAPPTRTPHTDDMRELVEALRKAQKADPAKTAAGGEKKTPASSSASSAPEPEAAVHAAEPAGEGAEGAYGTGLKGFNRAFVPAGTFFSAAQTVDGVKDLAHGKLLEGGLETVGGASGTASGLAAGAETYGLASSSTVVAAGATVGAIAAGGAGFAAIADGGLDFYHGVKTDNPELEAVGGVKTLGGGLLVAGAVTCNPLLVAAGAGLYTGAVIYQHAGDIEHGAEVAGHAIASGARAAGSALEHGVDAVGSAVSDGASSVARKVARFLPW